MKAISLFVAVFVVAFVLGYFIKSGRDKSPLSTPGSAESHAEHEMGPNLGPRGILFSPEAEKLAEIQVQPVEKKYVEAEIRMVGKVDYDETKLAYITAWVPGRLDRLFVDFTGTRVKKGDHLVYLYSPELLSAQEELIQASKTLRELRDSKVTSIKQRVEKTVQTARDKLRLWGLTELQIKSIEQKRAAEEHLTIYSPQSGIVIHRNAQEGMYVQTGTRIYTIADLSQVWVMLNAYESDLVWLRYGQPVTFETEAFPGETFQGKIAFIDPVLDPKTRTVKVRVNLPNDNGKLKPNMFVRGVVRPKVGAGGQVVAPDLAGKWICPLHPEIIEEKPGKCSICDMTLVTAESLGYATQEREAEEQPIVIPSSAPLITGKRAVVYVRMPDAAGHYEGREIVLGPRAGNFYIVKDGLTVGEEVVVNGNFKIDSAIQIMAKPSMMNPKGGGKTLGHSGHSSSQEKKPTKQ